MPSFFDPTGGRFEDPFSFPTQRGMAPREMPSEPGPTGIPAIDLINPRTRQAFIENQLLPRPLPSLSDLLANPPQKESSALHGQGLNRLVEAALDTVQPMALIGQMLLHGGSRVFSKFDPSFIGKGEGGQAFGAGFYFAEAEGVATRYAEIASKTRVNEVLQQAADEGDYFLRAGTIAKENIADPDVRNFIDALERDELLGFDSYQQAANAALSGDAVFRYDPSDNLLDAIDRIQKVFDVDLNDSSRILDWDKPVAQQHISVGPALEVVIRQAAGERASVLTGGSLERKRLIDVMNNPDKATGQDLYRGIQSHFRNQGQKYGEAQVSASNWLVNKGFVGHKFLDQFSRHGPGPQTRNFVVYPGASKAVKIEKISPRSSFD